MTNNSPALTAFFHDFERNSSSGDPTSIAALFADTFLAAGPEGSHAITAPQFAVIVQKRRQLFRGKGHRSTHLISVAERPLGERYLMADTVWSMIFDRPAGNSQEVTAESTFILDTASQPWKIVFYLAHHNPLEMLSD